jgi:hypothetical protein
MWNWVSYVFLTYAESVCQVLNRTSDDIVAEISAWEKEYFPQVGHYERPFWVEAQIIFVDGWVRKSPAVRIVF